MDDYQVENPRLKGWLAELAELPEDAGEWDEAETFALAVSYLTESKRRGFEDARGNLRLALRDFVAQYRDELTFFGIEDYDGWEPDARSLAAVEAVTNRMGELRILFDRHALLLRESNSSASLVVTRKRRTELESLEGEIVHLLQQFRLLLVPHGQGPDGSGSPELRREEPDEVSDPAVEVPNGLDDARPASEVVADAASEDEGSTGGAEVTEVEAAVSDPTGVIVVHDDGVGEPEGTHEGVQFEEPSAAGEREGEPVGPGGVAFVVDEVAGRKTSANVIGSAASGDLSSAESLAGVADYDLGEVVEWTAETAPLETGHNGPSDGSLVAVKPEGTHAAPPIELPVELPVEPTVETLVETPPLVADESASAEPPPTDTEPQLFAETQPAASPGTDGREQPAVEATLEQPVYLFSPEQTAAEIASLILEGKVERSDATLRDLVWRLVFEDRLGLAACLADKTDKRAVDSRPYLPAWLLRAAALGPRVRHANGEIAHLLRQALLSYDTGCFIGGDSEWDHAVRFLYSTAAMRPSVLAPDTDASSVLRRLHMRQGLITLHKCWQSLADYGIHRQPLDPNALKGAKDDAAWKRDVESLRQQVAEWSARAPRLQMDFMRATQVWRKWQEKGQLVNALVTPVLRNDLMAIATLKAQVERLSDDAEVRREIDHTDRRQLKNRMGDEIMARAYIYLRNHLRMAVGFARQWIELQDTRPGMTKSFGQKQAESLSREILGRREAIYAEIQTFGEQHASFYVRAGLRACLNSLEDIWRLFDSETVISFDEPDPKHILNAEFLKSASLRLDGGWNPQVPEGEVTEGILRLLAAGEVDWRAVFEARCEARDHEATSWVIEYLEGQPDARPLAGELSQLRGLELEKCRVELESEVTTAKDEVEGAVVFGLFREKELVKIKAQVGAVEAAIPETLRFGEELGKLHEVRREIKLKREEEVRATRERLAAEGIAPGHPAYARIADVLDRGDVSTANEYIGLMLHSTANELIDHALPKKQLPTGAATENTFSRFYPHVYQKLKDFMEPRQPSAPWPDPFKIANDLRAYARGQIKDYSIGPVTLKGAGGTQAEHAAGMLESWFSVKKEYANPATREKAMNRIRAKHILTGLGFSPLDWDVYQSGGRTWISLTTEPIEDRERCPLPAYGSDAKGRYRILCVWDRPSEGNLLDYVGDTSQGSPVIVLHFGRLTEQRRRGLAQLCRHRRRTFIVLDDTLMLFLCGEPEPRLRTLFECTLPFTFAEPYTMTPGVVPIEMFYGRERERRSIMNPAGSCFIYGGRQLGKTVLLRDVERLVNEQPNSVAFWIDLKDRGFGRDKKFDDLWGVLALELRRLGIPMPLTRTVTIDKFLESVEQWVEEDETRRLLLLLDEADEFLVYDGKAEVDGTVQAGEFMRADRLRGAMTRTNRRFKVVFAGLHNVQRTTRLANHPLAHYGDPICIGPLLDNGEWREARDLIERPMALVGYDFETTDLVTRILWQTNYYPSLIQIYCNYLLEHVTKTPAVGGPPSKLTSDLVDEAYLKQRKAIRDRLIWTLQLDQRYEVIAYAMALSSIYDKKGMAEGFTVTWIRQEALFWWAEGFRESSTDESIRTLLDEMVGLGILRTDEAAGRYALRSTNVAFLMGTEEEIEAQLLMPRDLPLQYEPATYRATLRTGGGHDEDFLRSPLTAQQESDLSNRAHGVSVIFGCRAAGVEDLELRLESIFGRDSFVNFDGTLDKIGLERKLSEILEQGRQGVTLALVPSSCPWSAQWVAEAAQNLKKKQKAKSSFVRVVFIANPAAAWQLITDDITDLEYLTGIGVTTLGLRPWGDPALRLWMDECRFGRDQQTRERISDVTGNWPFLLRRFFECSRSAVTLPLEHCISELSRDLLSQAAARSLVAAWGLDSSEATDVFRYLNTGEATADELALVMNNMPLDVIRKRLLWADHLGLVVSVGGERWRIDKIVGRLLSAWGD